MAGYTTVLAAIKTELEGVSGVVNVYDYPRWKDDITAWESLISSGSTLHFWEITRDSAPSEAQSGGQIFVNHTWSLWGWYHVVDADESYKTFQGIVDDVTDAFNDTASINIATNTVIVQPCFLLSFDQARRPDGDGGILFHRARIQLVTEEDKTC